MHELLRSWAGNWRTVVYLVVLAYFTYAWDQENRAMGAGLGLAGGIFLTYWIQQLFDNWFGRIDG